MAVKKDKIEWTFDDREVLSLADMPTNTLGFIYKISLEDGTGRYYIGRKTALKPKYTSGKLKGQSKGEYPWRSYHGSSVELNKLIKEGVKYRKEIIKFCSSKAEISYEETKEIICGGALTDPLAFNFWVKSLIYAKHLEPNS